MSQFERIACIDRLLREQGSVRTTEVAERFEVSGRQVKRDIEYLRDRLDAPVVSAELLSNLESHLARDYRPMSERISYELSLAEPLSIEDFTTVCQAILLGRRLDLVYVGAKAQRGERSVEPERLVNYAGRWYLWRGRAGTRSSVWSGESAATGSPTRT